MDRKLSMNRKNRIQWAICLSVVFLALGELCLRHFLGLANAPLYYESDNYEYMACPNQDGYRFGHHYHYNSYSQRSEEPDSTKVIVLGLGDSVLFGGAMSDQDSIATSLFTDETGMQMLNISAGSWGPDNCAAYIKEKGLFMAKAMFLLVSSHDAHDNMDFQKVVGVHDSYPNKQYVFAWSELIARYLYPRTIGKLIGGGQKIDPDKQVLNGIGIKKTGKIFNPGFAQIKQIADSAGIPLYVCLHPDQGELEVGNYNNQGQEIISWCKANGIQLIKELDEGISADMYRDGIHTNEKGQRFEADLMKKYIKLN
jgi:hypothetical protein